MKLGARLYKDRCSDCHQPGGEGVPRAYPSFAGNAALLMRNPVNAIRITLNGGFPPSTRGNPRPYGMPPFAHVMSDDEVAAVVTYIRGAWGNRPCPPRRWRSRAACRSIDAMRLILRGLKTLASR